MAHSVDGGTCDQHSANNAVIYTITHRETHRVYVGKTYRRDGRVQDRWKEHLKSVERGSSTYLHNSIRKYGIESFIFEIVDVFSKENLNDAEKFWILKLLSNVKGFGFNLTKGGDGGAQTDESVLRKMSYSAKSRRRQPMSDDTKNKIRQSKIGISRPAEVIEKIKNARRKHKTLTKEWREKISNGLRKTAKFKLTDDQKKEVISSSLSSLKLADMYGVHSSTIRRIRNPRTYKVP